MERISSLWPPVASSEEKRSVYTVSELTARIKELLEERFLLVWVEGEISQVKNHDSGHIFFTLKDAEAILKVILFRDRARELTFPLREGLQVLCFGRISVYPPRGEYRLIAQRLEPRGLGALQLAFEELKKKLAARGYFDPQRKKPLPLYPQKVALVTSLSGAALFDFLRVARERWSAEILIYPVRVQGEGAAEEIARALEDLNRLPDLDLIVVTRGGGSLEDLWAFNEEVVAEAVYRSRIPVVSAVGHEVDYTICDFVADHRAPTPSAAAQMVFPDKKQILHTLNLYREKLHRLLQAKLAVWERELHHLARRLRDPFKRLRETEKGLFLLHQRLEGAMLRLWERRETRFRSLVKHLEAVSPLAILARGYSVVRKLPEKRVLRRAREVSPGDELEILLAEGKVEVRVEKVHP